jgi:SAM-dependent methyltransferase
MTDDRDGENEEVRSASAEAGEAPNGSNPPPRKSPDPEEEALENAWGTASEAASYRRAVVTPPRPVSGPPRPVSAPPLGMAGTPVVLKSKPISVPPPDQAAPHRPRMNTPPYGSQPPPALDLAASTINVPPLKVPSIPAAGIVAPSSPTIVSAESAAVEAKPVSDSVPPTSRRLAPPPKPRHKSNPTEGDPENGAVSVAVPGAPAVPDVTLSSPPARTPREEAPPPVDIDFDISQADGKVVAKGAAPDGPSPIFAAAATVVGAPIETTPTAEPVEPRRSEPPPPPTHIVVPNDEVPAPPSKPTPAPAIQVMRIIAVGTPTVPASAKPVVENLESDDITEEAPPPKSDDAMELSDADVSPDSDRPKGAELAKRAPPPPPPAPSESGREEGREDAISILPEEDPGEQKTPASTKAEHKPPPPPPKRAPSSKRVSEVDIEPASEANPSLKKQRQRRPWWEELFSEDFVRANFKLSDAQVRREVNFIEESLGVAPGGVVLDLGCGAGHHAVELASRGYGVVGYDLSLYQLALAAEVAQERDQKINFLQGDMREMAFEEMFDGVFSWNTTFGYFEEEKNLNVAQRVFKALKPGGMFLVDVINRDFAATQSPSSLWYEGDACVCMDDMSVDFITSRLRVKRSIILDDGRTREVSYSIRLYSLHELGKLLHEVGFRVTEASGHPNIPGVFFGEQSPRIIMLAQKP